MSYTPTQHLGGLPALMSPEQRGRAKRQLGSTKGREKFLDAMRHDFELHPDFTIEPAKGKRDPDSLLAALHELGAGEDCYVIASDRDFDDTMQPLEKMVREAADIFHHGTIFSCVPGRLALYKRAVPHGTVIVHRT